ncbi:MAG TPA: hypothetical protein DHW50_00210 [Akkermansia sp.]|uniref:Uncharacterized protein n=1 Tax=Akkermansia massiliensis TaxID=2927224 RepID=A0AAE6TBV1_9BACT|nr:hypothetical protein [Akkermansia muciniphila]QHV63700.1 hypothetical protein DMI76_10140 [Akkermansia massiliensis]HCL32064.1 hypothetical protein [Akkermansia sp.]PNC19574.1 hypothetical protein CXU18_10300 [Akkermansia muciniphila]PNC42121.1 hypothetical protein CXU14_10860 [Akkermansia muciniphila]
MPGGEQGGKNTSRAAFAPSGPVPEFVPGSGMPFMGRMLFFMGLTGFHASAPAAEFPETSGFMMKSLGGFLLCPSWMASRLPEGPACRERK